jgi:hypothetical protein
MFMVATADLAIFLMQGAVVYNGWTTRLDHLQTAGAVVYVTNKCVCQPAQTYVRRGVLTGAPSPA